MRGQHLRASPAGSPCESNSLIGLSEKSVWASQQTFKKDCRLWVMARSVPLADTVIPLPGHQGDFSTSGLSDNSYTKPLVPIVGNGPDQSFFALNRKTKWLQSFFLEVPQHLREHAEEPSLVQGWFGLNTSPLLQAVRLARERWTAVSYGVSSVSVLANLFTGKFRLEGMIAERTHP